MHVLRQSVCSLSQSHKNKMADGKTQVIIITSNEDLIREISSKKRTNTHLIDLDDNEHQFVNLTVLAQLSQSVCI